MSGSATTHLFYCHCRVRSEYCPATVRVEYFAYKMLLGKYRSKYFKFPYPCHWLCSIIPQQYSYIAQHFLCPHFFYPCLSLCSIIQLTLLSTILDAHLSNPYHSLCSIIQQNLLSYILGAYFSCPCHSLCSVIQQQYSYIAQHSWCTHFLTLSFIVLSNTATIQMYCAAFLVHTFLIPVIHCAQ